MPGHAASRLEERLKTYAACVSLGKGLLSVLLVVTEHARERGLPLDPTALLTPGEGQVVGLGGAAVRKILARHSITDVLAREGGRTSRSSARNMREYVDFLNDLHADGLADHDAIEAFWIAEVQRFLAGKPFRLTLDPNRSLRSVFRHLFEQAFERQRGAPGRTDAGAVLQHLVGAKLACALRPDPIYHHSHSTADAATSRPGDFAVSDAAFHVTTSPSEALIERCRKNLDDGLRPILITLPQKTATAADLAENAGLAERFDILDIEQFLVLNLYEWGRFETRERQSTLEGLVSQYNTIVDAVETDPSLKIAVG